MSSYQSAQDAGPPLCSVCGQEQERESCWSCGGEGGFHDCGEDCCCCLYPDLNVRCDVCGGQGSYWICPHSGGLT